MMEGKMKREQLEERMRRAVYALEKEFPKGTIGLLLLGAVPHSGGFNLLQIGNVSEKTALNMLVAALNDVAAGKVEIKGPFLNG
jgi:hypothetical protein